MGGGVRTPPPCKKTHTAIGFLRNTGPDTMKNHEATVGKPIITVNVSLADDGTLFVVFESYLVSWSMYDRSHFSCNLALLSWATSCENLYLLCASRLRIHTD